MNAINRTIDTKYLRTFTHVARHRSFTAAAESLYLTQPAVSQHIKKIESTIGARIFDRKDGFMLTSHGKILLEYADQTMFMYERLFKDLAEIDTCKKYSIAISDSFNTDLVEKVVNTFLTYNDTELAITAYSSLDDINTSNYDLVFGSGKLMSDEGKIFPLNRVKYILAYNEYILPDHELPKRVVFCNSLTRREAETLIDSSGVNLSEIKSWLTTSSSRLMSNELKTKNTYVICPSWAVSGKGCYQERLRKELDMYVWCNESAAQKIDQEGLKSLITDIFNENIKK